MTVEEYRKKCKRCRTCIYAKAYAGITCWDCLATNKKCRKGLAFCQLKGMFCPLYVPKMIEEVRR